MAAASWLNYVYHAYLSNPKGDRILFRTVKRRKACRIVELGIGSLARSRRLIEIAQRNMGSRPVAYSGLDWFDTRPETLPMMRLKDAYRVLHTTGAETRLIPGDPAQSLLAVANEHVGTDILVISWDVEMESLASAWFYVPRMLHPNSVVLRQVETRDGKSAFERIAQESIEQWAGTDKSRRAA